MPAIRKPAVLAALAALGVAGAAAHQVVKTRRALIAERAARRLTAGMQARDFDALSRRLNAAVYADQVLAEADLVLNSALATHRPEGGAL